MKIDVSPSNGAMPPIVVRRALDEPQRSGADRDDPAAFSSRAAIERRGGRRIEAAPFRVHDVVVGVLDLDGQEGARADVQRHAMEARARGLDALDQGRA